MHPSLNHLDHRPWTLASQNWKWQQSWLDLGFIHYRVDVAQLRRSLPPALHVQEFDGSAWVGLVPFQMAGVTRRPLPPVPYFSTFPELNLRTYVEVDNKPGVWFFSLDADSWPIVIGGRTVYGLPYYPARMEYRKDDNWHHLASHRRRSRVTFAGRYRPLGEPYYAAEESFEHWATERYCLYAMRRKQLLRVEVHHAQWPLQRCEVEIESCDILAAAGVTTLDNEPVAHFSSGVEVISFGAETIQV